ncbi:MAG: response regulator transcription factor [Nitrospirae bacterium]|nr:response regulator transcription factor [Nitrospirota bacterium]
MSVRALIVDDEPHLVDYLAGRLAVLWPELEICGTAINGIDGLEKINKEKPDLVFLDIKMPGLTGLDVAGRMSHPSLVVFITAYNKYAVKAFEEEAVDYLLKPISDERLSLTIARTKKRLEQNEGLKRMEGFLSRLTLAMARKDAYLNFIRAASGRATRLIPVDEVLFFRSTEKYTAVFTKDREFLIRVPIVDLIKQLDPEKFWQIHRSTVVNVSRVASAVRDEAGRLVLKVRDSQASLVVSRPFVHLFKQM